MQVRLTLPFVLVAAIAGAACAEAQSAQAVRRARPATVPAALRRAAATISPADVQRRVEIIAHDSMMGRDTPSRGLDLTAQYVADEFKRLGLKPGGENGTWFQRYPILKVKLDVEKSHLGFMGNGQHAHADFTTDARWLFGPLPAAHFGGEPVVLAGIAEGAQVPADDVQGRIVVWIADMATPTGLQTFQKVARDLRAAGPKGIVIVSNRDDAGFERMARGQTSVRTVVGDGGLGMVEVRDRAVAAYLQGYGVEIGAARQAAAPMVKVLAGAKVMFDVDRIVTDSTTAPNTVGILEGTDPVLKKEYLVYSAHMDHIGVQPGQPDSIANGADDDASGTVGVIELAEAFSRPGARPKRSIVFLTVSGEEKGLWGSEHYAEHPTVPLPQIVANINIDMIGRNWKDSIVAIGREHSDLGATLAEVNARHPELRMTAIDDVWPEERFYFRSDHYNFARKGVPILFFFNGVHDDYHRVSDEPSKIDAEKEARILQLLFYLGHEIASKPARPKWNPESYRQIVETAGR
jgi:hypothetical protein